MLKSAHPDSHAKRGYCTACPFTIRLNTPTMGLSTPTRIARIKAFSLLFAAGTAELL